MGRLNFNSDRLPALRPGIENGRPEFCSTITEKSRIRGIAAHCAIGRRYIVESINTERLSGLFDGFRAQTIVNGVDSEKDAPYIQGHGT